MEEIVTPSFWYHFFVPFPHIDMTKDLLIFWKHDDNLPRFIRLMSLWGRSAERVAKLYAKPIEPCR